MMELHDFVSKTLVQIIRGVEQAHTELKGSAAQINPPLQNVFTNTQSGGANQGLGWAKGGGLVSVVQFDVALTVHEGQGTKGGIGVVAGVFALGSQGASDKAQSAATRVQFSVPIKLPGHDVA
jgi:hypothetical protein